MKRYDPNIEMLEIAADGLGELVEEVVFLGGCAAGLLVTDPAAPLPRETKGFAKTVAVVLPCAACFTGV